MDICDLLESQVADFKRHHKRAPDVIKAGPELFEAWRQYRIAFAQELALRMPLTCPFNPSDLMELERATTLPYDPLGITKIVLDSALIEPLHSPSSTLQA
jgi:hypothetical protein